MTSTRLVPVDTLHEIVEIAARAPSVHNTQPWRWRGGSHTLELYADTARQLPRHRSRRAQPHPQLRCGPAPRPGRGGGARVADPVVRHPDPRPPDLLARLDLSPGPPSATADETLAALDRRCTDRRRFTAWPVPEERQSHLARIANHWGARAVALTDESERFIAERLVRRAHQLQRTDPAARAEQAAWQHRGGDDGLPADALPGGSTSSAATRTGSRARGRTGRRSTSRPPTGSSSSSTPTTTRRPGCVRARAWVRCGWPPRRPDSHWCH